MIIWKDICSSLKLSLTDSAGLKSTLGGGELTQSEIYTLVSIFIIAKDKHEVQPRALASDVIKLYSGMKLEHSV